MRIVAGSAGGIPLALPKTYGPELRPTMEVVKNAIFNSLGDSIEGTAVLDLFAGIGGLGIEALSRGATRCVFIESDRAACEAIRKNLEKARLAGGEVVCARTITWLEKTTETFHLILADPPYAKRPGEHDHGIELLHSPALRRALRPGGLLVLEYLPGQTLPLAGAWEPLRQKRYGATEVAVLRPIP